MVRLKSIKQSLIILFLCVLPLSSKVLKLTQKEIDYIQSSPKKSYIVNRFKQYKAMLERAKDLTTLQKLSYVNTFFNKILPVQDATKYYYDDYWATRKEFMIEGQGDCEDYSIAKYFTLLELGIPKEKLYFAVVQVRGRTTYHMNLLYIPDKKAVPLVLDNLSFKVVPLTIRKKLIPKYAFNEIDSYTLTKTGLANNIKINWGEENKWEVLLDRIYNKNE